MLSSPLLPVFLFFFLWISSFLFAVVLLNYVFFNMNRSRLKIVLKFGDFVIFVLLPPLLMLLFREHPLVKQILNLKPESLLAWSALSALGVFWLSLLVAQGLYSLKLLRANRTVHLLSNHTRVAPYHPQDADWDLFEKEAQRPFALRPGSPPPSRP